MSDREGMEKQCTEICRDMLSWYEQRQLGELNKKNVFFNCLPNNDLSKIALKFSIWS